MWSAKTKLLAAALGLPLAAFAGDINKAYLQKFYYDAVATESYVGAKNVKRASGVVVRPDGTVDNVIPAFASKDGVVARSDFNSTLATSLGDWQVLAQGQDIFGNWTEVNWQPTKSLKTVSVYNPWRFAEIQCRFEPMPGKEQWVAPGAWHMLTSAPMTIYLHPTHPPGARVFKEGYVVPIPWGNYIHDPAPKNDGYRSLAGFTDFQKAWAAGYARLAHRQIEVAA